MTEQIINDNVEMIKNQEIVETNLITISEIIEDFSNVIIKSYIPYVVKSTMIKNILDVVVFENEQGLKTINYSLLSLVKEIVLFNNYTNVSIFEDKEDDENNVEDTVFVYDKLKEIGVIDYVLSQIPHEEFYFFDEVINKEIEQIQMVGNGVSSILAKTLNKIVEKLPDQKSLAKLIKNLPKQINKIDPDKLKYVSDAIGWNNGVKKDA